MGRIRERPTVYGRVVHKAPLLRIQDPVERNRAFEALTKIYSDPRQQEPRRRMTAFRLSGGGHMSPMDVTPQSGSFQHLKARQSESNKFPLVTRFVCYRRLFVARGLGSCRSSGWPRRWRPGRQPSKNWMVTIGASREYLFLMEFITHVDSRRPLFMKMSATVMTFKVVFFW